MNKKIKVVEFVTRLEFGGVEAMLLNYFSNFENLEYFDIHIITQDINDQNCIKEFEKIGCKVHIVTHKRKSIWKNFKEIFRIMGTEKFDVVHTHMTMTNFYVLIMAKILRVPVRISHSHSSANDIGLQTKLSDFILKKLNKLPANVWMACGYDAGVFLFGKKDVDNGKVFVVKNAIDLKKFLPNERVRKHIRNKYGVKDEFLVGHIGRFMSQKNHKFVIEIFKEVLNINPSSKLLLVGDGELRAEVNKQVEFWDLESKVIFTGNVTNTNELYQAIDVFILPSLYEGLPVVSIEAQAAGLPCIISDKVDNRCAITQGIKFLSIEKSAKEWAKEILRCLENTRGYSSDEDLTKAGYNIEIEAKKLEDLYRGFLFQ